MPRERSLRSVLTTLVLVTTFAALSGCGDRGPSAAEQAAAAAREAEKAADDKAREERKARIEAERLAVLWRYQEATVGGGRQVTASILSVDNIDTDGRGAKPVQLVFRDHAAWGRSSYLVLQAGDFDCAPRCAVSVTVDDLAPEKMAARRPNTDEAIAMFINDAAMLWRLTSGARRISIEFPVKAGGTRMASFDVAGLDESKMPGWGGGTE
jgi:predicted small lipoprotein YifL